MRKTEVFIAPFLKGISLLSFAASTLLALLMLSHAGTTLAQSTETPHPTISLNGEWQFLLAEDEKAADSYRWFFEKDFDASEFTTIPVPSNWVMHGFEQPHWVNGTKAEGFYLFRFTVPDTVDGLRSLLHFGGVWQSAEVWLNGQLLGRHDSGFTSFAYETTAALQPGEENLLAVRVRQQPPTFKLDANDDWALAGIYRDVHLEFTPKGLYLGSVEVETDFDDDYRDADLNVRVHVERRESGHWLEPGPPFDVRASLTDSEGHEVASESKTVTVAGAHNGRNIPLVLSVSEPQKWTAETPHLYQLQVELVRDGEVTHAWEDRVGFREVSIDGNVLKVNGQPVKLRGVATHDQHPDVGRATQPEHWESDIRLMKEANINAVRTAHYPHAEGFIRLCDEMGLYVVNEVPLGFGGERMHDPSYAAGVYLRVHETVTRDRNRPSVIIWSHGNEDPLTPLQLDSLRALKGLDTTRPVLLPFRVEEELPPEVDIRAPHYWDAKDYDELAADSSRPIVTTEYTHALGPDDFGGLQQRWDALTQHAAGAGGMIWLWADQGLRRPTHGQPVLHPMRDKDKYTREGSELVKHSDAGKGEIYDAHGHLGTDGIVDPDRTPQQAYWETKAVYAPVRFLTEQTELTPGDQSVSIPVRNEFDFLDLATVRFLWRLKLDDRVLATGETSVSAEPHATAELVVPTGAVDATELNGALYIELVVLRSDDSVLTEQSVRLKYESQQSADDGADRGEGSLEVAIENDLVQVTTATAVYRFDSSTGTIKHIELDGKPLVKGSEFVTWRPATFCERNQLDRRENQHDWDTFMQGLEPEVKEWNVEESDGRVMIRSQVEYRHDDKNSFAVDTQFIVHADGALEIDYKVIPDLDVPTIPEIGIEFDLVDKPLNATWLGQGPGSSLPNRQAATRFGYWTQPVFSGEIHGTRSGVEWLKIVDTVGRGVKFADPAGFRVVGVPEKGATVRVFSHLAGAWTKNGPPEREEWRLDLDDGSTFSGSIQIAPVEPEDDTEFRKTHPAVVSGEFIYDESSYPSCHASTIAEVSPGNLVAAWFGGTHERHPDVGIWVSRMVDGKWQKDVEVADGVQEDGNRYPTWNPVLFQPPSGPLHLFYKVGPNPREWWGMLVTSDDGGKTWSQPERLPDGFLGPVKNKPEALGPETWLSPSSTETPGVGWRLHFELTRDAGKNWEFIGPVDPGTYKNAPFDSIQPSILIHGDGRLQALCRTKQGVIGSCWSEDNGHTWSAMTASELPNPNSGTDAVTLADGRHLVVYNHTFPPPERPQKGVRYPVDVAVSNDGVHWQRAVTLESAPYGAGYAYPAMIQTSDGLVHITYTWDRKRIRHVVLDPDKL